MCTGWITKREHKTSSGWTVWTRGDRLSSFSCWLADIKMPSRVRNGRLKRKASRFISKLGSNPDCWIKSSPRSCTGDGVPTTIPSDGADGSMQQSTQVWVPGGLDVPPGQHLHSTTGGAITVGKGESHWLPRIRLRWRRLLPRTMFCRTDWIAAAATSGLTWLNEVDGLVSSSPVMTSRTILSIGMVTWCISPRGHTAVMTTWCIVGLIGVLKRPWLA